MPGSMAPFHMAAADIQHIVAVFRRLIQPHLQPAHVGLVIQQRIEQEKQHEKTSRNNTIFRTRFFRIVIDAPPKTGYK